MLYAQVQGSTVIKWPVLEKDLRAALSDRVLPSVITDADLVGTEYVCVPHLTGAEVPQETVAMKATLGGVELQQDGTWKRLLTLVPVPLEQQAERRRVGFEQLRRQRDRFLSDLDWRYLRNAREVRTGRTPTEDIAKIDAFANTLADLPASNEDPFLIKLPANWSFTA